ncbi:MAG: hypothetical protein A3D65_05615 [Candidatus Lloydbacteria bacterium RIFCSPHIGHO2_02_FULL_50_13]|uniref:Uncharacterized protein n=1 Tax=Candidatus Lloydbacteria bacterium RIFCSPHIGHO2_02_FULL_50_13 TaxID=1798661 RepID=A0A1G2D853_9BACT|nr:MAG: hypothetical protein A3D65_05615 [Candidatus Lloydbacteria bacterium RIFCSPHIGHO2_02_FULL_50_13]
MAGTLNEKALISVTLRACTELLKRNKGHRLYYFLAIGAGKNCGWLILPQHPVRTLLHGWSEEDKVTIDGWLGSGGFRAFMLPDQRARFRKPVVDFADGKLFIRSGKKKITPLE